MILFFGMQIPLLGYGILYLVHSLKKKRHSQAATVSVLLLLQMFACGVLLWEYMQMP